MAKLSKDERAALETWTPGLLGMPVHRELEHQMEVCRKGIEDAIVIGPGGVGKTEMVKRFCNRMREEEARRTIEDPSHLPAEVLYYEASRATGPKTGLLDLYKALFGGASRVGARFQTPASLRDHIADELQRRNVRLICIDEAQLVDAANLDLLRQVPDAARSRGHAMGLMLIGNEELRDSLVAIRQMGQRFSAEVQFHRISRKSVGPHFTGFHPHLPALKDSLKDAAWRSLEEEVFRRVNGSFRRLEKLVLNANELVLKFDRRMDEKIVRLAIGKLALED